MPPITLVDPADEDVSRILVVTAHPDDCDFGGAGTTARWTDRGIDVVYCIVTSGEAGGADLTVSREARSAIREDEQRAAAKVVGVEDVRFLRYPDGRVEPTLDLRRDISRVIRQVRPDRIVTQSPERNWARIPAAHPDHLAVGEAVTRAFFPDAGNPWAHPELLEEGLEPHTAPQLWLYATKRESATVAIDITDTFDRKIAALSCHVSQHPDFADSPRVEFIREWGAGNAVEAGLPPGRLCELFQTVGI